MFCVLKKLWPNSAIDVGQNLPFPLHGNTNIMVIKKNARIELVPSPSFQNSLFDESWRLIRYYIYIYIYISYLILTINIGYVALFNIYIYFIIIDERLRKGKHKTHSTM